MAGWVEESLPFRREPAFETSQKVAMRFFSMCEEKIDVVVFDPERLTAELRAAPGGRSLGNLPRSAVAHGKG